jgi:hypothetical protein
MPRAFWPATAEQVVAVVDAVVANKGPTSIELAMAFADLPREAATSAANLAVDLGLLSENGSTYEAASPLCRFLSTSFQMQQAAVIRILLETYEPFTMFRERMAVVPVDDAAEQTRALLTLDRHREDIKATLVSLGTFSQALVTTGGGQYEAGGAVPNPLVLLADACSELVAAEARVREHLGTDVAAAVSRDEIIVPLADALVQTRVSAGGAVRAAGNAVESLLAHFAPGTGVNVGGAHGVTAKVQRYLDANVIPAKLAAVGKYLGNVRNAADHGVDPDIGVAWTITESTGVQYVFVACSFVASFVDHLNARPGRI